MCVSVCRGGGSNTLTKGKNFEGCFKDVKRLLEAPTGTPSISAPELKSDPEPKARELGRGASPPLSPSLPRRSAVIIPKLMRRRPTASLMKRPHKGRQTARRNSLREHNCPRRAKLISSSGGAWKEKKAAQKKEEKGGKKVSCERRQRDKQKMTSHVNLPIANDRDRSAFLI